MFASYTYTRVTPQYITYIGRKYITAHRDRFAALQRVGALEGIRW